MIFNPSRSATGAPSALLTHAPSPRGPDAPALLEREGEVAALDALVEDLHQGRGRMLLIQGPAGIGKTRLLDEARNRAEASGARALTARGGELELDLGFGVVRQMLEAEVASAQGTERSTLLGGAARLAQPALAAEPGAFGDAFDAPHAVLHGLYWLTANLAERSALLLTIDDAHWADPPSLRFLLYLARRLDGMRAAVVLTLRTGEPTSRNYELLRALAIEAHPPIVSPRPLTEAAAGDALGASLGRDSAPRLAAACHRATGGNPFLLMELIEEFQREGRAYEDIDPEAIPRLASDRIAAALLLRIGRLDPRAPAMARAVAVLGAGAGLRETARLAGLEIDAARHLATRLADADVLEDDLPLRFVHPLVRASVYEEIPAAERAELHRRAAEALAEGSADPEVIALHLLPTDPGGDPEVVAQLRAAGRDALARGSPETTVSYLRRALDEPPDRKHRPELLLELGIAESLLGEAVPAAEHLRTARGVLSTPADRIAATRLLAGVLGMNGRAADAIEVLKDEVEVHADTDPRLSTRLAAHAVNTARMSPAAWHGARDLATRLRGRVVGGHETDPEVLAAVAGEMAQAGDPADRTAAVAESSLADLPAIETWGLSDWSGHVAVRALVICERFDLARQALDALIASLRSRGAAVFLATCYAYRSDLLQRAGELDAAEEDARAGYALCVEHAWPVGIPALVCWLVVAMLERGEIADAESLLEQHGLTGPAAAFPDSYTFNLLLDARGRLRLAQDRPAEAAHDLLECGRRQDSIGEANPAVVAWRSAAAPALLRIGDADRARSLAAEELERARAFGAPRALGVALRGAGLVEPGAAGIARLTEAVEVLEASPASLENARALVDLGAALRRAGRSVAAREHLSHGMDMAHRCGAVALRERAHRELTLAGARPRRIALTGLDSLTPAERRVAEMAAGGMTNKEIAQALFVILRTVEMHLTSAYRKLGITSRRELAQALAAGTSDRVADNYA